VDGAPAFDPPRQKQRLGFGRDRIALSVRHAAPRFDRDPAVRSLPDLQRFRRRRELDVLGSRERGLRLRPPSKGRYRLALLETVEMPRTRG
jgi:hypothetical protein